MSQKSRTKSIFGCCTFPGPPYKPIYIISIQKTKTKNMEKKKLTQPDKLCSVNVVKYVAKVPGSTSPVILVAERFQGHHLQPYIISIQRTKQKNKNNSSHSMTYKLCFVSVAKVPGLTSPVILCNYLVAAHFHRATIQSQGQNRRTHKTKTSHSVTYKLFRKQRQICCKSSRVELFYLLYISRATIQTHI